MTKSVQIGKNVKEKAKVGHKKVLRKRMANF